MSKVNNTLIRTLIIHNTLYHQHVIDNSDIVILTNTLGIWVWGMKPIGISLVYCCTHVNSMRCSSVWIESRENSDEILP